MYEQGRLPRETNPTPGSQQRGFVASHDTTGNEDYRRTSPKDPLPTNDKETSGKLDSAIAKLRDLESEIQSTNYALSMSQKSLENIIANQERHINILQKDTLIYGVHWDKSSDPTMTRTESAVGLVAEVGIDGEMVRNDFDTLPIWGEIEDYTDIYGNEFIKIPKFYIRKHSGKDFYLKQVSKTRHSGFYLPNLFWDFENNKELPYALIGKYEASLSDDGTKLESRPNKHPLVEENIVTFRNLAKANGKGYQQNDIHAIDVIQTLFTIEFATMDSQSIMRGHVSGNYNNNHTAVIAESNTNRIILSDTNASAYEVGQTLGIGSNNYRSQVTGTSRSITEIDRDYDSGNTAIYFDGDAVDISVGDVVANRSVITGFSKDILASSGSIVADDSKNPIVYRGIENPWGNIYEWIDGINVNDRQTWIAADAEDYASNVFASPYEKLAYVNHDVNGYVKEMGYDPDFPYAEFAVEVGGSTSTYYADYYHQNTGQRVARFGGYWGNGSPAGLWLWNLINTSSSVYAFTGGRLLKKTS